MNSPQLTEFTFGDLFPRLLPCLNCSRPLEEDLVISTLAAANVRSVHLDVADYEEKHSFVYSINETNNLLKRLPIRADIHVWPSSRKDPPNSLRPRPQDTVSVHFSLLNLNRKWAEWLIALSQYCQIGGVLDIGEKNAARSIDIGSLSSITLLAIPIGTRGYPHNKKSSKLVNVLYRRRESLGHHFKLTLDGGVSFKSLPDIAILPVDYIVAGSVLFGNPPNIETTLSRLELFTSVELLRTCSLQVPTEEEQRCGL